MSRLPINNHYSLILMVIWLSLSLLTGYSVASPLSAVGVTFPTRVLYPQSHSKGVAVTLKNTADNDYLLQSKVVMGMDDDRPAPFIVLPPLVTITAGNSQVLRLQYTGAQLPTDRESVFWLSVRIIPQSSRQHSEQAALQLVNVFQLKLFYRPKAIEKEKAVATAVGKLTAHRQGAKVLVLHNPTPYYLTIAAMQQGNNLVEKQALMQMVPPFGEQRYPFSQPLNQQAVTVIAFDEQGYSTAAQSVTVS